MERLKAHEALDFTEESELIKYVKTIDNISEYQCGELPTTAEKLDAPVTTEDMMKKSTPIAIALCLIMFLTMFIKTFMNKSMVIFPPMVLGGLFLGFLLIIIHEWLHAIVYPKKANVTIGKLKGKMVFVALASYPLKRNRFIFMCLLPFLLGIIPTGIYSGIYTSQNIGCLGIAYHKIFRKIAFGNSFKQILEI